MIRKVAAKMYSVYKHTTPNGKVYIGITGKEPEKRWMKGRGYQNNPHFSHAIKFYGWENIEHEIVRGPKVCFGIGGGAESVLVADEYEFVVGVA